ncbi:unnamed protein product [Amoebophrya sp. A25]|nr:unnamed protein product [Amoebophrya sp. A25]|eukprot:GSA25T00015523001.1
MGPRGRAFPRRRSCAARMAVMASAAASVPGVKMTTREKFLPVACIGGCAGMGDEAAAAATSSVTARAASSAITGASVNSASGRGGPVTGNGETAMTLRPHHEAVLALAPDQIHQHSFLDEAKNGNFNKVFEMLDANRDLVDVRAGEAERDTALMFAAHWGDFDAASKLLIDYQADATLTRRQGATDCGGCSAAEIVYQSLAFEKFLRNPTPGANEKLFENQLQYAITHLHLQEAGIVPTANGFDLHGTDDSTLEGRRPHKLPAPGEAGSTFVAWFSERFGGLVVQRETDFNKQEEANKISFEKGSAKVHASIFDSLELLNQAKMSVTLFALQLRLSKAMVSSIMYLKDKSVLPSVEDARALEKTTSTDLVGQRPWLLDSSVKEGMKFAAWFSKVAYGDYSLKVQLEENFNAGLDSKKISFQANPQPGPIANQEFEHTFGGHPAAQSNLLQARLSVIRFAVEHLIKNQHTGGPSGVHDVREPDMSPGQIRGQSFIFAARFKNDPEGERGMALAYPMQDGVENTATHVKVLVVPFSPAPSPSASAVAIMNVAKTELVLSLAFPERGRGRGSQATIDSLQFHSESGKPHEVSGVNIRFEDNGEVRFFPSAECAVFFGWTAGFLVGQADGAQARPVDIVFARNDVPAKSIVWVHFTITSPYVRHERVPLFDERGKKPQIAKLFAQNAF